MIRRIDPRCRTLRKLAVLMIAAGLLFLASAAAAQSSRARVVEERQGRHLELPSGEPFHRTDRPVVGLRTLNVRGDALQLYVWEEELPSGEMQAYTAVGRNGSEILGRVRPTTHIIRFRHERFDPVRQGAPPIPPGLLSRSNSHLHLVQFEAAPLPEFRDAITRLGGKVLRFLSDHTFIVEMPARTRARVARLPYVRWIGPYHPFFRLDKELRDAVASGSPLERQRYSILLGERGQVRQQRIVGLIRGLGGKVELVEPGGFRVEAMLTHDQLAEVVQADEVQFIDLWGGPGEVDLNIVRAVGGADFVESVAGFTGQGVRGEIFDTELLPSHREWANAPIIHSATSSGCSSVLHGTSCFSNNFAQGIDANSRGMIPDGQGIFFCHAESTQFGGTKSRFDANAELIDPAGPFRAVFQTSSVGSSRTTNYTTISAETDDYLFQHQILSTQSQSNAGNRQSRPQAWAKNIVSVGGFRHFNTADRCDDSWSSTASIGPASDGRIKPDLAFFFDSIRSASGGGTASYTSFGGTSSATPQTSGYFGLLFQMWHEGVWAGHGGGVDVFDSRPKMATAKALMINHAFRYEWTSPGGCSFGDIDRFKQGWGTADAQRLFDRASVTSIIDETEVIAPLETKSFNVTVQAGESELNVTMVYTDPMGTVGAAEQRINDLSLRVTSPSSTVFWGNNGLTSGNVSTPGGSSNTVDTVENVFIRNPQAGSWTIEVLGDEIVQDAHVETAALDADFALVVSGGLIGGAVNTAPTVNITAPANGTSVVEGTSVTFSGTASDAEDGNLSSGLSWTSSLDGTIGSGASFSTSTLSVGSHTITASVSDSGGLTGSDSIGLNVTSDSGCTPGGFSTDFENGFSGWTTSGLWHLVTNSSCASPGFSSASNAVYYGQDSSCTYNNGATNSGDLISPTITGIISSSTLSFDFFRQVESFTGGSFDRAEVAVSVAGSGTWTTVWSRDSTDASAATWGPSGAISLSSFAGNDIQLRFRFDTVDGSFNDFIGWFIDDVVVTGETCGGGGACAAEVDFESGAAGWTNSSGSTCSTGAFVVGTPTEIINGGVTTQLAGDHTTGSGNAFFSATNSAAGTNDVDGGTCIVESPIYSVSEASNVSVFTFHGQRDNGDDSGDFFRLEISTDGGASFSTLRSLGDVTSNAAWVESTTTVAAGSSVQFRLQVADGPTEGDLVEAGIDDVSICPQ